MTTANLRLLLDGSTGLVAVVDTTTDMIIGHAERPSWAGSQPVLTAQIPRPPAIGPFSFEHQGTTTGRFSGAAPIPSNDPRGRPAPPADAEPQRLSKAAHKAREKRNARSATEVRQDREHIVKLIWDDPGYVTAREVADRFHAATKVEPHEYAYQAIVDDVYNLYKQGVLECFSTGQRPQRYRLVRDMARRLGYAPAELPEAAAVEETVRGVMTHG